jgi:hypothetical protein
MSRLIDADEIYKEIIQNEDLAMDRVVNTDEMIGDRINPMSIRYTAQLDERTAFKFMIIDAPTVDAVPVIRCKDCKHYADNQCDMYADETLGYVHSTQADGYCWVAERKEE